MSDETTATDEQVESAIHLNLNSHEWILGEDGFYYYKEPLKNNEITSHLFTTVRFDGNMGNEYQNSTLTINVFAQAVQTANNAIPADGDVTDVEGWPASE